MFLIVLKVVKVILVLSYCKKVKETVLRKSDDDSSNEFQLIENFQVNIDMLFSWSVKAKHWHEVG